MVLRLNIKTTEDFLSSEKFINTFNESYTNKSKNNLITFLNNIETNKKYYKLGINKKKFKRSENNDTVSIKQINSLINKITDDNYINIINQILPLLKKHYLTYIIENIIEKSLMHHIYIHLYVNLLNDINNKFNIEFLLNKEINSIYTKLMNPINKMNGETYEDLCNKNNNLDKLCGLSLLISNLEQNIKIDNNTNVITSDLIKNVDHNNLDYIYKILLCIQNIFSINKSLLNQYINDLNKIKNNKINSKIKFKIMDILDI